MSSTQPPPEPWRARDLLPLGLILLVGAALRWAAIQADGLWMDELYSASYLNLSLWEIVVAVLRFDLHPPGYYLQLALWALFGQSDEWLRFNSIAWSLLTVAAVALGTAARAGRIAGLSAAALTAVLGSELFFASELRMYAMVTGVVVLAWWCIDEWQLRGRRGALWLLAALLLVLSSLHSVAFLACGSLLAYAWLRAWQLGRLAGDWKTLSGLSLWTALVLLPWLANASLRSVSHTQRPGLDTIADTLGGWSLGYFPGLSPWLYALCAAIALAVLLFLLLRGGPPVRAITLAFVLGPIVLVAAISWLLRPIWLDRTLAYAAVFVPIALAMQLSACPRAGRHAALWGAALVLLQAAVLFGPGAGVERLTASRKMQVREAAQFIAQNNPQQLAVHVPQNLRFWGIARYLVGPQWGSLLAVQDPQHVDDSTTWERIYARLGDEWLSRLHLKPRTRTVASAHGTLWIGKSPLPEDIVRAGYFFVGDMNDRERPQPCPAGIEQSRTAFVGVMVFLCRQP